jgi:hypothetical protein
MMGRVMDFLESLGRFCDGDYGTENRPDCSVGRPCETEGAALQAVRSRWAISLGADQWSPRPANELPVHGGARTITFGRWPELLLGEARQRPIEAGPMLAVGVHPVEQAQLDKIAQSIAATNSFKIVAEEFLEPYERPVMP